MKNVCRQFEEAVFRLFSRSIRSRNILIVLEHESVFVDSTVNETKTFIFNIRSQSNKVLKVFYCDGHMCCRGAFNLEPKVTTDRFFLFSASPVKMS